jgi:hypothetical protein
MSAPSFGNTWDDQVLRKEEWLARHPDWTILDPRASAGNHTAISPDGTTVLNRRELRLLMDDLEKLTQSPA